MTLFEFTSEQPVLTQRDTETYKGVEISQMPNGQYYYRGCDFMSYDINDIKAQINKFEPIYTIEELFAKIAKQGDIENIGITKDRKEVWKDNWNTKNTTYFHINGTCFTTSPNTISK